MKDNRGFSLIEMILVIAIMAILMTVTATGFGLIDRGRVKENAGSIASALEAASYNTQAVAAKAWTVEIVYTEDSGYMLNLYKVTGNSVDDDRELVDYNGLTGNTSLLLSTEFSDGSNISELLIDESHTVAITFEKQTGEVIRLKVGSDEYDTAKLKDKKGVLKNVSGNADKEVEIYWSTGKVFTN